MSSSSKLLLRRYAQNDAETFWQMLKKFESLQGHISFTFKNWAGFWDITILRNKDFASHWLTEIAITHSCLPFLMCFKIYILPLRHYNHFFHYLLLQGAKNSKCFSTLKMVMFSKKQSSIRKYLTKTWKVYV